MSLGIFGTFVGVYIGLLGFNVEDISASIPVLLNGFSNRMAEMGVDALVQALGQVVNDFNTLLNDLVGSAFQDMSTAIGRSR